MSDLALSSVRSWVLRCSPAYWLSAAKLLLAPNRILPDHSTLLELLNCPTTSTRSRGTPGPTPGKISGPSPATPSCWIRPPAVGGWQVVQPSWIGRLSVTLTVFCARRLGLPTTSKEIPPRLAALPGPH